MNLLAAIVAIERDWYGVVLAFAVLCLVLVGVDVAW
jgi:hypothetical protein